MRPPEHRADLAGRSGSGSTAAPSGIDERFRGYAELWAGVLRGYGVDARVGPRPGSTAPARTGVNVGGVAKLVGTAQRIVRGAWLFSAVLIFDDAATLRPVLDGVYRSLELPFDPASVGSVRVVAPRVLIDDVEAAVVAAYPDHRLEPGTLEPDVLAAAQDLLDQHRIVEG